MNPAWVMVAIAAAGIVFQAGISFSVLGRINKVETKVDGHGETLGDIKAAQVQHEWRITSHDQRLHAHDQAIDLLRSSKD